VKNVSRRRHGIEKEPGYSTWTGMRTRCHNPNSPSYENYGGRGIVVCDRWRNSYVAFREDMGPRPPGMSIHRIDNDGPYSPDNCVWADRFTQARVRRGARLVRWEGARVPLADACDAAGVAYTAVMHRLVRGLTFEQSVRRIRDYTAHMNGETPEMRMCMGCYRDLPLAAFHKASLGYWGRASKCAECSRAPSRRKAQPATVELDGEHVTIYRLAQIEGVSYHSVRWQMKSKGMSALQAVEVIKRRREPRPQADSRVCAWCHAEKPINSFPINPQGVQGRRATCSDCTNARARQNYRAARIRRGLGVRGPTDS